MTAALLVMVDVCRRTGKSPGRKEKRKMTRKEQLALGAEFTKETIEMLEKTMMKSHRIAHMVGASCEKECRMYEELEKTLRTAWIGLKVMEQVIEAKRSVERMRGQ